MRIACLQTQPKNSIESALKEAIELADEAIKDKAEFLFLPEYCGGIISNGSMYNPPSDFEKDHLFLREIKNYCKLNKIYIFIGSIAIKSKSSKIFNRGYLINPNGKIVSQYDKIHLFDIFLDKELHKESDTVQNGNKAVLIKTKHGTFGHTICYDIRFPHLYRKLSQAGAQILLVPAAFTKVTGKAHWHILNRARAIENISFVISACSFGKIAGGGECYGHSLIIDPWGKVLKDGGKGRGVIADNIDINLISTLREKLPSLKHDKKINLKYFNLDE